MNEPSVWDIHSFEARKLIIVSDEGETVTVDIDQDNIGEIMDYFKAVEGNLNG